MTVVRNLLQNILLNTLHCYEQMSSKRSEWLSLLLFFFYFYFFFLFIYFFVRVCLFLFVCFCFSTGLLPFDVDQLANCHSAPLSYLVPLP